MKLELELESNIISKRRGRQLLLKERDKKLLALYRKKIKLAKAKKSYNWIELDKPERYGYCRFFVVREDIAKGFPKMLPILNDILKVCNDTIISRDKKFLKRDYNTKKMVPIIHQLKDLSLSEYSKLPSDKHRELFKADYRYYNNKRYLVYTLIDSWMFSLKTKTNYITHRFLIDPKLDSELKEIENKIERNNLWPQIANAFSWDWSHHGPYKESDRMRNIIQALDLDFKQYLVQD